MSETFSGGCQCGAVRYELLERPTGAHLCHCRMCQKQFGNFYAALASVPKAKLRITRDQMANFHSSAEVRRGFCKDCGTPMTYDPIAGDTISIAIPTLDDYSQIVPENQYGIEARLPWVAHLHALPASATGKEGDNDIEFAKLLSAIERTNRQHPDHDTENWPPR